MIVNRHPKLEMFSPEDVELVHQASLEILAEVGFALHCEEALDILEATPGTRVDRDEERVWLDPQLVERSIAQCPPSFTLHARNPRHSRTIGGDNVVVFPAMGCAFTHDLERGWRMGKLADVVELNKIIYQLPETDGGGTWTVVMEDVPVPLRPHVTSLVTGLLTDRTGGIDWVMALGPQEGDLRRDILAEFKEAVAVTFGSDWDYVAKPVTTGWANSVSPLMYDDRMAMSLVNAARVGQIAMISPAVMGGISGPMTFAGMVAQQNAEVLAGLVLVQAVRPGNPVCYGNVSTIADMKVGAPVYGTPEMALSIALGTQLARRYGLPNRGGGGWADSKLPDAQTGYEHMHTFLVSVLSGVNLLTHAAGAIGSMLASSYEMLVLDQDVIGMVKRMVQGPAINRAELAVDVIREVGPQGMFLTHEHTYHTFRTAYFEPMLADRQIYAEWVKRGARSAAERATEKWKQLLADYRGPELPLPEDVVKLYHERIRRTEVMIEESEDWPRHLVGLGPAAAVR
ncbi:MAG: trimethylamine methyltransferase family protein [Chloroflexi bacterium]|nr:trimethylamine methyltransferase family protein [Chloroflexota bacterium]